ncbi:hypothetical protein J7K18_01640 [bacterium]|nr:hypothetical protein [bacterium]
MKRLAILFILLLTSWGGWLFADIPRVINYQAKLTDADGVALNGDYDITFSIWDAPTGGIRVWGPETHTDVTVTNGLFDVQLGTIIELDLSFADTYWVETSVEGTTLAPRQMLSTVPYAFRAIYADTTGADNDWQISGSDIYTGITPAPIGNVGIGIASPLYKLDVNGTVNMTGFRMPTGASAGYVLTSDGTGVGTWQPLAGGGQWIDAGDYLYPADDASEHIKVYETATPGGFPDARIYGEYQDNSCYGYLGGKSGSYYVGASGSVNTSTGPGYGVSGFAKNSGATTEWQFVGVKAGANSNNDHGLLYGVYSDVRADYGSKSIAVYGVIHDGSWSGPAVDRVGIYASADAQPEAYAIYGRYDDNNYGYIGASGHGIYGKGTNTGVQGVATGTGGGNRGVFGNATGTGGSNVGVYGLNDATGTGDKYGVMGSSIGTNPGATNYGVWGQAYNPGVISYGVYGTTGGNPGYGVYGTGGAGKPYGYLGGQSYGVYGNSTGGTHAGYFDGDVKVNGTLSANHYRDSGGNLLIRSSDGSVAVTEDADGSYNITTSAGGVGGSGTPGRAARWTGTHTLGNSAFYDDGTNVAIGTGINSSYRIYSYGGTYAGYFRGNSYGVYGTDGTRYGILGQSDAGVYGYASSTNFAYLGYTGTPPGISYSGCGTYSNGGSTVGVFGYSTGSQGVSGFSTGEAGVMGQTDDASYAGVFGRNISASSSTDWPYGYLGGPSNGVYGYYHVSSGVSGAGKNAVHGYLGESSGALGGSGWENSSINAGVKGYAYWGNPYTAAVGAYSYIHDENSCALIASYEFGSAPRTWLATKMRESDDSGPYGFACRMDGDFWNQTAGSNGYITNWTGATWTDITSVTIKTHGTGSSGSTVIFTAYVNAYDNDPENGLGESTYYFRVVRDGSQILGSAATQTFYFSSISGGTAYDGWVNSAISGTDNPSAGEHTYTLQYYTNSTDTDWYSRVLTVFEVKN